MSVSVRIVEVLIALILVLFAFGIIMILINNVFPTGSGLIGILNKDHKKGEDGKRNMVVSVGDYEAGLLDIKGLTAVLDRTKQTVKRKPAGGIAWESVDAGAPLFDQDAVQTFRGSGANIVFDKSNRLSIGENSLIIVQHLEKDMFRNERRSQIIVVDGELSGTISGSNKQGLRVEVATSNAVAAVSGEGEVAEFTIKVNPDKSSTLTVYSGTAEFTSMGQRVVVTENQSITAKEGVPMQKAEELPPEVKLDSPSHKSLFYYRDLPTKIDFKWKNVKQADNYRIQISKHKDFNILIVDDVVRSNNFSLGNLYMGDYFWRVNASHSWAHGPYSKIGQISVVQDKVPPLLKVNFPNKIINNSDFILTGVSEPGVNIFVTGEPISIAVDGTFSKALTLQQGVNILVVEAVDMAGNVTYHSQMVYGKF